MQASCSNFNLPRKDLSDAEVTALVVLAIFFGSDSFTICTTPYSVSISQQRGSLFLLPLNAFSF